MTDINDLSDREREILFLVATGASNKEIAHSLYISTNTVKVHLRNIFAKISVTTRTEAAMFAVSTGLVKVGSQPGGVEHEIIQVKDRTLGGSRFASFFLPSIQQRSFWILLVAVGLILFLSAIVALFVSRGIQISSQSSANSPLVSGELRWQEETPLPTARQGLALAVYRSQIFAIAGETEHGVTGVVERYDPESDSWTVLTPKPVSVTDIGSAVIGGRIYIPGGRLSNGDVINLLEIYDPHLDRWTRGRSMPKSLSAYAIASFEGKIYIFGGWDGKKVFNDVYEYDPDLDQWHKRTDMPTARAYAGATVSVGKIYILGGYDGRSGLSDNEIYIPNLDNGRDHPWEQGVPLPQDRYGMGVISLADAIYVIGGIGNGDQLLPSLQFIPPSKSWWEFESPIPKLWSHLGVVPLGSYIYAIGGMLEEVPSSTNINYQAIYTILVPVINQ